MNKIKTTIGQRFLQVVLTICLSLPILSLTPYIFNYEGDSFIGILFIFSISFIPLILICIIQYIIYGNIHPLYLFKNEIKKDES